MTYKFKERIQGYYHYIYELTPAQEKRLQLHIDINNVDTQNPTELWEAIKAVTEEPTFEGTEVTAATDFDINTDTVLFDAGIW